MRRNGFLEPDPIGTIADLLAARGRADVITAETSDRVRDLIQKMKAHGISRIPVVRQGKLAGVISEKDVMHRMAEAGLAAEDPIEPLAPW